MNVLKVMLLWLWDEYKNVFIWKGYIVYEREDKKGIFCGYVFMNGNIKYKVLELGIGRNLMVLKFFVIWKKLYY